MLKVECEDSLGKLYAWRHIVKLRAKARSEIKLALSEIAPLRGAVWEDEIAAARRNEIVPYRLNEIHAGA